MRKCTSRATRKRRELAKSVNLGVLGNYGINSYTIAHRVYVEYDYGKPWVVHVHVYTVADHMYRYTFSYDHQSI